ncbi:MAG: hypothetical protein U0325_13080 [Polyangiales bacterium]
MLEDGVVVTRVYAQHEEEARTEGSGYIYFFPGGVCERAVVHLRGADGVIYSVTLNGLSGRTQIIDHAVEPPSASDVARRTTATRSTSASSACRR